MKYDIFISYRRQDSSGRSNVPMARTFKLEFERRGYKVFFDYSECADNYFSETILPAIRTCDFFVLILTADSLSRCFNERDWVRREIEEALTFNKKIIPITPDNECGTWSKLPDSLSKLDGLQITTIHTDHMFEGCVSFLIENRFHIDECRIDLKDAIKCNGENNKTDILESERTKGHYAVVQTSPINNRNGMFSTGKLSRKRKWFVVLDTAIVVFSYFVVLLMLYYRNLWASLFDLSRIWLVLIVYFIAFLIAQIYNVKILLGFKDVLRILCSCLGASSFLIVSKLIISQLSTSLSKDIYPRHITILFHCVVTFVIIIVVRLFNQIKSKKDTPLPNVTKN